MWTEYYNFEKKYIFWKNRVISLKQQKRKKRSNIKLDRFRKNLKKKSYSSIFEKYRMNNLTKLVFLKRYRL